MSNKTAPISLGGRRPLLSPVIAPRSSTSHRGPPGVRGLLTREPHDPLPCPPPRASSLAHRSVAHPARRLRRPEAAGHRAHDGLHSDHAAREPLVGAPRRECRHHGAHAGARSVGSRREATEPALLQRVQPVDHEIAVRRLPEPPARRSWPVPGERTPLRRAVSARVRDLLARVREPWREALRPAHSSKMPSGICPGSRSENLVVAPFQCSITLPVGPLRCLATMISAMFLSVVSLL